MKNSRKKYDAVKEMRAIRERLSLKYWKRPDLLMQDMKAIREKYNFEIKEPKKR